MDFESKKIWRYGDDVDTDVIIPARYLAIADWNELANMRWKILILLSLPM